MKKAFDEVNTEKLSGTNLIVSVDALLLDAMVAGVSELEVSPEEFKMIMRYAIVNNVYSHIIESSNGHYSALGMKLTIV